MLASTAGGGGGGGMGAYPSLCRPEPFHSSCWCLPAKALPRALPGCGPGVICWGTVLAQEEGAPPLSCLQWDRWP